MRVEFYMGGKFYILINLLAGIKHLNKSCESFLVRIRIVMSPAKLLEEDHGKQ